MLSKPEAPDLTSIAPPVPDNMDEINRALFLYNAEYRRMRQRLAFQDKYPGHVIRFYRTGDLVVVVLDDTRGTVKGLPFTRTQLDELSQTVPEARVYAAMA